MISTNNNNNINNNNINIIQYIDKNNKSKQKEKIPRFCYHEYLSIAGNCRMCLLELNEVLKPIASCAVNLPNKGKIYTNSSLIKHSRKGILEFLLANHPLDCPICDQGGECDLQDESIVFGNDKGRFYEYKRSVKSKNFDPLIKTYMNRCIHCTRCIRFINEISNISDLGIINRGKNMEIGTYIEKMIDSELSGNIIDLCPVGALTSKTFAFNVRSWELYNKIESIDILDSFNSKISYYLYGNKIVRILPSSKENNNWITNKTRFFYDSLNIQRLYSPVIKYLDNNKLLMVSWKKIYDYLKEKLFYNDIYKFVGGDLLDLEFLIYMKKFITKLGNNNYNHDFFYNKFKNDFRCNIAFTNTDLIFKNFIKNKSILLILSLNLRKESPLLNYILKKNIINNKIKTFSINTKNNSFNHNEIGNNNKTIVNIVKGKHWFCNIARKKKNFFCIYGLNISSKKDFYDFFDIFLRFNNILNKFFFNVNFNYFNIKNSMINHLEINFNKISLENNTFNILYFINNYKEFEYKINNIKKIFMYIYQIPFLDLNINNFKEKSIVLLPNSIYIEEKGTYISYDYKLKRNYEIIKSSQQSKTNWEIIKLFSNIIKLDFPIIKKIYTNYFNFTNKKEIYNIIININKNNKKIKNKKYYIFNHVINNIFFDYYNNNIITNNSLNLLTYKKKKKNLLCYKFNY